MNNKTDKKETIYLIIVLGILAFGFLILKIQYAVFTVTLAWGLLCLLGIDKNVDKNALSLQNTSALRGICAIEIMLGHIGISTRNIIQFPNKKAGILFVGLFLMISGYGLMFGLDNKKDYLKNFWPKRLGKMIPIFLIILIVDFILNKEISLSRATGGAKWYVYELIILYILFYISYSLFKKNQLAIVFLVSMALAFLFWLFKFDNPWYGSTLCFPLGMAYYKIKKKTGDITNLKRIILVMGLFFITGVTILGFFLWDELFVGVFLCRNIASVSFCFAILLILEKFTIGNKMSLMLGMISYEIYLIHGIFIRIFEKNLIIENDYLFTVAVIGTAIATSFLVYYCDVRIKKIFSKAKKGKK